MQYVERDDYKLKNRVGEEMSDEEKEIFEKKSEFHEFERQIILSPRDDYENRDMEEATRDSINSYFEDAETVDYCYAVHDDGHSHVILTGDIDDLYMNKSDLKDFTEKSKKQFKKREPSLEKELKRENGLLDKEKDKSRSMKRRQPRWMQYND